VKVLIENEIYEIPDHMRWIAQDQDGEWWRYIDKPVWSTDLGEWGSTCSNNADFFCDRITDRPPNPDWKDTLRAASPVGTIAIFDEKVEA